MNPRLAEHLDNPQARMPAHTCSALLNMSFRGIPQDVQGFSTSFPQKHVAMRLLPTRRAVAKRVQARSRAAWTNVGRLTLGEGDCCMMQLLPAIQESGNVIFGLLGCRL